MSRVLPILFNTEMVRAILDGRKTVTRRVIKPQPIYNIGSGFNWKGYAFGTDLPPTLEGAAYNFQCAAPYQPGDILYVPKEAARIWLKVTDVRVERLQDITDKEAGREGTQPQNAFDYDVKKVA